MKLNKICNRKLVDVFNLRAAPSDFSFLSCAMAVAVALNGCVSDRPAPVVEREITVVTKPSSPTVSSVKPVTEQAEKTGDYIVKKGDTLYSIALDQGVDYRDLAQWNNLENPAQIKVGQSLKLSSPGPVTLVNPIVTAAPVETRTLESAPTAVNVINTPKALKLPYSEQAVARLKGEVAIEEVAPTISPAAKLEPKTQVTPDPKLESKVANTDAEEHRIDWAWPVKGKIVTQFSEGSKKGIDIASKVGEPVLASASGKVIYTGVELERYGKLAEYGKLIVVKHNNLFLSVYAYNHQIFVKEGQQVVKGQKIGEVGLANDNQAKLHFEIRRQGSPVDPTKYLPQS